MNTLKISLKKVRLNRQGYAMKGESIPGRRYFGVGLPVYLAEEDSSDARGGMFYSATFRARDRKHAKELVRADIADLLGSKAEVSFYN